MKKFIFAVLLMVVSVFAFANAASAQTTNDVRITAGGVNVNDVNTFTANVEVRKAINERFQFEDALSTATDGDVFLVQNRGAVKAFLTQNDNVNLFVSGGLTVGKANIQSTPFTDDMFLNPSFQAGLNFNVGKVNLEPYVQLDTPDLLSNNSARSLSVAMTGKVNVTDNFGFIANGGVRSTRLDNSFFTEASAQRFAQAGVFFNF